MRWKRGLFRLWVVLSVIWACLAVMFFWDQISEPSIYGRVVKLNWETKTYEIGDRVIYSPERDPTPEGMERVIITYDDVGYLYEFPEGTFDQFKGNDWIISVSTDVQAHKEAEFSKRRLEEITAAFWTAILPPGNVLAIGMALAWAISGFRRNDDVSRTVASRLEDELTDDNQISKE